jgi:succinate dehydrogenase/fumarate reductase flavoprotein subunit
MKMKWTQKKIKKGSIRPFLAQKLIKANEIQKSIQDEVHAASLTTLRNNEVSTAMVMNVYTGRSDAFFRFLVVVVFPGRADLLQTLAHSQ